MSLCWNSRAGVFAVGLSVFLGLTGCSRARMDSAWCEQNITVDGSVEEWTARHEIEGEDLFVGIQNDAEFLYVTVTPGNVKIQRQMMMLGFTVWLDPEGGQSKCLGLRFPLGMELDRGMLRQIEDQDLEALEERFSATLTHLEILREGTEPERLPVGETGDLEVSVNLHRSILSYELKVPLTDDLFAPVAVGAAPGVRIGVGFETPAIDRDAMRAQMEQAGGRQGGKGGGMRGGRRGGGRGGSGPPEMPEPLGFWMQVLLAKPPAASEGDLSTSR